MSIFKKNILGFWYVRQKIG